MTDEPRAPEVGSPGPGEGRDQQLASLLDVPALDETTRRRLVRTAAERAVAPAASRSSRSMGRLGAAVGVAAALLVGAAVGAVVVTRPSDPETPTAARATNTEPTTAAAEAAAPAPQSADDEVSAQAAGAPPQELGDLGTVRGIAELRAAISAGFEQGGSAGGATPERPCRQLQAGLLGFVVVSAIGEAQLDGLPVVVLVGPTPTGEDLVVVLDPARGCEIVQRVTL